MDYICVSHWNEGVTADLYGEIEETFVCDGSDHMMLLGWIMSKLSQGFAISVTPQSDT